MMNKEQRCMLKNEHDLLSKVKLEDLFPFLKEYKLFNRYMWNDIKTTEDMLYLLPRRGPTAFRNIIEILRKAKYFTEADQLEGHTLARKSADDYYVMSTSPLGFCLIINNVKFQKRTLENAAEAGQPLDDTYRKGSDVDATSLRDFLKMIDFNVTVERNKKAQEMYACLKEFASQDFKNVDSVIIIILSHGGQLNNKDFMYGTDWERIYKSKICDLFNNKNEELQNKPKVFFFIGCRGKDLDYGVSKCLPSESIDSNRILMPSLSDMFVIHSTLPEQVSIRDNEKGTYFCEEFVTVLKEHFRTHDLETIIKLVNRNLQNRVSRMYRNIQVAHIEVLGGMKKFMFCKT